jgi:hypothetical protein
MNFIEWFTVWFSRHPLKAPSDADRSRFTSEVMARVRSDAASRPAVGWARSLAAGWPRLAVTLAAAAAVLVAVTIRRPADIRLAETLVQDAELLASVGEPVNGWLVPDDVDSLAEDLEHEDLLVLAEAPEDTDASWIAETLEILDRLDEDLPEGGAAGEPTDEQWLEELETLDEHDLAARS